MKKVILFIFFGLFSLNLLVGQVSSRVAVPPRPPVYYSDYVEIIFVFNFGETPRLDTAIFRRALNAQSLDSTKPTNAYLWNVPRKADGRYIQVTLPNRTTFSMGKLGEAIGTISGQAGVQSVSLNNATSSIYQQQQQDARFNPNTPFFGDGLYRRGSRPIRKQNGKIAVLDCGAPSESSDAFLWQYIDIESSKTMIPDTDIWDEHGHGTAVASIIARFIDRIDAKKYDVEAPIVPIKVLDKKGTGKIWYTIKGVDAANRMGVNFINLSLISLNLKEEHSNETPLQTAIDKANNSGILVICAAGNQTKDLDSLSSLPFKDRDILEPAMLPNANLICVGATKRCANGIAPFSNLGKISVDIFAPGDDIYVMGLRNTGKYERGTSFAAPFVAGRAIEYYLTSSSPPLYTTIKRNILETTRIPIPELNGRCVTGSILNEFAYCSSSGSQQRSTTNTNSHNGFSIYPNPSSGASTISFSLEQEQNVSLNICDLQGRLVQTIVPQSVLGRGEHQFSLENSVILRGGIYFCRLETEAEIKVQKLVIKE